MSARTAALTCAERMTDTGALPAVVLVDYVACDGREIPVYTRRPLADVAVCAVIEARRLLALLAPVPE